jgi:iron uptake system component EfeO
VTRPASPVLLACAAALTAALTGCTQNAQPGTAKGDRSITVESTATDCTLSRTTVPSGRLSFTVTNSGSQVTEFYLLGADGLRIVSEAENIGPGLSRDLVVSVPPGTYVTACKPGMKGEGIRGTLTVTDSGAHVVAGTDREQVDEATEHYADYVQDQSAQLLAGTRAFVKAYKAGEDDRARSLYPRVRTHWERIETVAESFGDLDPRMDAREADLEPGSRWTGWHRLEKDLWPQRAKGYTPLTPRQRATYADRLLADTRTLDGRVQDLTYTVDQIANGSRGLLDEVATGKVTGEEEYWSRTDLWDFQANVDGARVAYEGLAPIVEERDADLAKETTRRFAELQDLLDEHRRGDGFVGYDALTPDQVKRLSDAVNALSEPLSELAAAVV